MERQQIIESIKNVARATLPLNSSLFLYGSRASGEAQEDSDWDLLILIDKSKLTVSDYALAYPFRELGWDINEEISPQVYSKKEWNDFHYTPFYKNIEREKIVLI